MPGIRGGHIKKMNADKRERLRAVLLREPYLENSMLAIRFGLSTGAIQEVRKRLIEENKIEKITSVYVTNKELRGRFKSKTSPWLKRKERGIA
jgi:hypothetical protein